MLDVELPPDQPTGTLGTEPRLSPEPGPKPGPEPGPELGPSLEPIAEESAISSPPSAPEHVGRTTASSSQKKRLATAESPAEQADKNVGKKARLAVGPQVKNVFPITPAFSQSPQKADQRMARVKTNKPKSRQEKGKRATAVAHRTVVPQPSEVSFI